MVLKEPCEKHDWEQIRDSEQGALARAQVHEQCVENLVTFQFGGSGFDLTVKETMETALEHVVQLNKLWKRLAARSLPGKLQGSGRGNGSDYQRQYVGDAVIAMDEYIEEKDRYEACQQYERRALPIVVMGMRKPRLLQTEMLWQALSGRTRWACVESLYLASALEDDGSIMHETCLRLSGMKKIERVV